MMFFENIDTSRVDIGEVSVKTAKKNLIIENLNDNFFPKSIIFI